MIEIVSKWKNTSVTAKASIVYTFANLISKSINIISVPIFTRIMSTSEIGVSTTYTSWYSILYAIITLSLCSGSFYIGMLEYKECREQYESACLTLSSISACFFAGFYIVFSQYLNEITTLDTSLMVLMIISLLINPALDFWYAKQRFEYKYKSSAIMTICVAIIPTVFAVLCVIWAKKNTILDLGNVRTLAQVSVTIFISLGVYILIMFRGKTFVNVEMWKFALKVSVPLIIHSLAKNVLDVSDRIMISYLCGKSEAGIYGTIYSISLISLLVWNAINASLIPIMFEKLENQEYEYIETLLQPILVIFGVITLGITLIAPEIVKILLTDAYFEAVYLIPALSGGTFLTALYNIYGNILMYKKKTTYIMSATTITALVNIALNYVFINIFGYIAAAYTTFLGFILLAVLQRFMVNIVYKKKVINDNKILIISLGIAILCLGCNILYSNTILRYVIILVIMLGLIIKRREIIRYIKF